MTASEGVSVYIGTTGAGKTYRALADLRELHAKGDRGAIVVDSAGTKTLRELPQALTLEDAIRRAWGPSKELVRWTPLDDPTRKIDSERDFERLMNAARHGGNVRILVDELSFWARCPSMLRLGRIWRASNVTLLFTAQHVGADVGQSLLACNPRLYIFRVTAPRSLEFAEKYLGLDPNTVRAQGLGENIEVSF